MKHAHRFPISYLALGLAVAGAVPAAGAAEPGSSTPEASSLPSATVLLDRAATLLRQGRAVQARAMISELTRHEGLALDDAQRAKANELLRRAHQAVSGLERDERKLQEAELALAMDDLTGAVRLATSAAGMMGASDAVRARAVAVVELAEDRQAAIAPRMVAAADKAIEAFGAGDYATAKSLIGRVNRSGVELDHGRRTELTSLAMKINDLEMARGTRFETGASLSMFSPEADWLLAQPSDVTVTRDGADASTAELHGDDTADAGADADAGSYFATQPNEDAQDPIEKSRQFAAKRLLGEADQAFEENRMQEAQVKYDQLLSDYTSYLTAEEVARAQSRRDEARTRLGASAGPSGGTLDDVEGTRDIQRQRFEQTFSNLMAQADRSLEEGDADTARNLVAQAQTLLEQNRSILAEANYESKTTAIEEMRIVINDTEERLRNEEAERRASELAARADEVARRQMDERDRKVVELIGQVRTLQLEMKYEEALSVVEQILELDPINPSGLLLQDLLEDAVIYRRYWAIDEEKRISYAYQSLDNNEAMIAPRRIVEYPADWPAITLRRGQPLDFADSPANRAAYAQLREPAPPIDFEDNLLTDVLGFIQTAAGINMDIDWDSLADIGVTEDSTVSLRLENVGLETVLDRVLEKVSDPDLRASWTIQDGIIVIASEDVLRLNTTLELYDIRDLLFEIPYFDNAPEFDLGSILSQSGQRGGGGGQSPFSGGTDDPERQDREERITEIIDIIQNNIDPNGWIDLGGSTGAVDELNGNLIITQTPRNHRLIIGLLNKLREVRNMQINVEARFLLVDENFFEQIGFDLDVYFNPNNEFDINRLLDPSLDLSDLFDENGELRDNITGGGFLIDTDGDGIPDTPFTQPLFPPGTQGDQWSVIRGEQDSLGITNTLAGVNSFASSILASSPALGITGRFLDDIQVDFLVEATQADQRSVTLTAPRLTFTNGQRAFIAVTTSQTFVSDLQPIVSDSAVAFDPQISAIPSGVVLDIEGVVSADRRYVTLNVIATNSSVTFGEEREFAGGAGGTGGSTGEGNASAAIQVPIVDGSTLNTTVTIPDQGTVLLGGQRVVTELEVETGVPVLSKIPFLSRFFSNRVDAKTEQTLLILIKPTILIQDEEEERAFPGVLDSFGY